MWGRDFRPVEAALRWPLPVHHDRTYNTIVMLVLAILLPGVLIMFTITHFTVGSRPTLARGFVILFGGYLVSMLLLVLLLFAAEIWAAGTDDPWGVAPCPSAHHCQSLGASASVWA